MVHCPLIDRSKGESRGAGVLEHGQWSLVRGSRLMVGADPRGVAGSAALDRLRWIGCAGSAALVHGPRILDTGQNQETAENRHFFQNRRTPPPVAHLDLVCHK